MKKTFTFLILTSLLILLGGCGPRSDETTPEMAQSMLKVKGYNFTEEDFFRAIKLNEARIVRTFLQAGMDPNVQNKEGETALTYALQYADDLPARVLIEQADINMRDRLGNSPIHLALRKNKNEIFKMLLEKGADVNVPGRANEKTRDQSVLYVAVARNDEALVRDLLERGADPNKADSAGSLPLVEAVVDAGPNPEIVKMLLEKGADVNKAEQENGATALIFIAQNEGATAGQREEIVKLLLAKGADKSIKENEGKTALDWARKKKHQETVDLLK